jgi:CRISPR/Cas system Type II protein with McrA/HNH and RuvC-like nuclease domain
VLVPRQPVPSYRRTSIRRSPYGYWVVTFGTGRQTATFPTGAEAIAAVENGIKRIHARRILEDLRHQQVRATRMHRLRQRLANRDGPGCHYCDRHLPPEKRTIDHVIPKVLKGPSSLDNFVLACGRCNRKKGHTVHPNHCAFCATAAELYWSGEQYVPAPIGHCAS